MNSATKVGEIFLAAGTAYSKLGEDAIVALAPWLQSAHNKVMQLTPDVVEPLLAWTSHPSLMYSIWQQLNDTDALDGIDTIEILLLLTPIVERSLGDLLITTIHVEKVPSLLKDLLLMHEMENILGQSCLLHLQLLLGSPFSLNLRNLVWHGFVFPGELSFIFCSGIFVALLDIGQMILKKQISIEHRPLMATSLTFKIDLIMTTNSPLLSAPFEDIAVHELVAKSTIFYPQNKAVLARILTHRSQGNYFHECILLLPLLESCLRQLYVRCNKCPERSITAEATSLYTTFTEMLTEETHLQAVLGQAFHLLLMDLLILPNGPRLRDRLSHGEVFDSADLKNASELVLTVLCWTLIIADNIEPSILHPFSVYQSTFHPTFQLARNIIKIVKEIEIIATTQLPTDFDFEKCDSLLDNSVVLYIAKSKDELFDEIKSHLRPYNGNCLYRSKMENEIIMLLGKLSEHLSMAAVRLVDNLEEKKSSWAKKEMRSRARNTFKMMLELIPKVYSCLVLTVSFLFNQLQTKDTIGSLAENKFNVKVKRLKKALKAIENVSAKVHVQKNRWDEVDKHCDVLKSVIFEF